MSYSSRPNNEVVYSEQLYQQHPGESPTRREGMLGQYHHGGAGVHHNDNGGNHMDGQHSSSSHNHPSYYVATSNSNEYYRANESYYPGAPTENIDDGSYGANGHNSHRGYSHPPQQPPHSHTHSDSNLPPSEDRRAERTNMMEHKYDERLRSSQHGVPHQNRGHHHHNENSNENNTTRETTHDYPPHQEDTQDMSSSSSQATQQVDNSSGGAGSGGLNGVPPSHGHQYGGAPPPSHHHQAGAHSPTHGVDMHHGHQQYQAGGGIRPPPPAGASHGGYYSHSGPGGYHGHSEERGRSTGAGQGHYYREQEQSQPPQQNKAHYSSSSGAHAHPGGEPSYHRYGHHGHGPPPPPPPPHQSYQHHGGPPSLGREGPSSHSAPPPLQHHQNHHYQGTESRASQHYSQHLPHHHLPSPPRPGLSQSSEAHGHDENSPPAINRKHSSGFLAKTVPQAPPTVNIPQFLSGPVGSTERGISNAAPSGGCTCKKSRCLKLYCQCFASSGLCTPSRCKCQSCHNTSAHRPDIEEARRVILERNPMAFEDKFRSEDVGSTTSGPRGLNPDEEGRRWEEGDSYRRWHGGPPQHSGPSYHGSHQGGYSHGGRWEEGYHPNSSSRDRYPGSQPPSHYHQQGQHYSSGQGPSHESHHGPLTEHRPPPPHHHPDGGPRSMGMGPGPHGGAHHGPSSHHMQHPQQHPHYSQGQPGGMLQRKPVLSHKLGCKCRRSFCLKKYCECYHHGAKCGSNCRCVNCRNKPDGAGGAGSEGDKENISNRQHPSVSPQPGQHHNQQEGGMESGGGEPPNKRMRDGPPDEADGTPHGSPPGPPRGSPMREGAYERGPGELPMAPSPSSRYQHPPHPSPPHTASRDHRIKAEDSSQLGMPPSDRHASMESNRQMHHGGSPSSFPPVRVPSIPPHELAHDAPRDDRYASHGKYGEGMDRAREGDEAADRSRIRAAPSPESNVRRSPASVLHTPQGKGNSGDDEAKLEPRRISIEDLGPVKQESERHEEEKKEVKSPSEGKPTKKKKKKKDDRMAIMAALAMTALGGKDSEGEDDEEEEEKPSEKNPESVEKKQKVRVVSEDSRSESSPEVEDKKRKYSASQDEAAPATADPSSKRPRARNESEPSPTSSNKNSPEDDESSIAGNSERGTLVSHGNVVSCSSNLSSSPEMNSSQYHRGDGANNRDPSPLTTMPRHVRYENPPMHHGGYGPHGYPHSQPPHPHPHYAGGRGPSYHHDGGGHYDGMHHHQGYHHGPPPPRTMHERHHGPSMPRGTGPTVVGHDGGQIIHTHPPPSHHGGGGTVSPSSAHTAQDTMSAPERSPMSSPSSKCEDSPSHHPALPRSLSFRKICSRCGKTRSEHGELGFGNKCVYQDCGKCGAGIQMHDRAGVQMGFLCSLTVEDGATPGAVEAYERKIRDLAVRAEMKQVVQEREQAPGMTVAV